MNAKRICVTTKLIKEDNAGYERAIHKEIEMLKNPVSGAKKIA